MSDMRLCADCRARLREELRSVLSELAAGARTEADVAAASRRGRSITEAWTQEVRALGLEASVEVFKEHAGRIATGSGGGGEAA